MMNQKMNLKEQNLRLTKQRQIILDELRNSTSHPTADEVYEKVRQHLPRISLGTVYRNLELMSSCGLIQKLTSTGLQKRFDGNPEEHYHIRCLNCGQVRDLDLDVDLNNIIQSLNTDYQVMGHKLEFMGLCPQCRQEGVEKE
jgi:Fur family ferric uptake transcriptional regulator